MNFDKFWHVSKIGNQSHLCAIGTKREADGVGGVVRNLKSVDIYIPNGETLPGLNCFHSSKTFIQAVRKSALQSIHGLLRNIQRRFPKAEHLRQAIAVVAMFVGDEDAVDAVDVLFDGCEAR